MMSSSIHLGKRLLEPALPARHELVLDLFHVLPDRQASNHHDDEVNSDDAAIQKVEVTSHRRYPRVLDWAKVRRAK